MQHEVNEVLTYMKQHMKLRVVILLVISIEVFMTFSARAVTSDMLCVEKNIISAKQFTKGNKTYIIRKDIDLSGQIVSIPKNCVLKFDGGKIKNGTVIFNGTTIKGKDVAGVLDNIIAKGMIKGDCYAKWFVNSDALTNVLSIAEKKIYLEKGSLFELYNNLVFIKSGIELYGNGSMIKCAKDGARVSLNTKENIVVQDITIDGNNRTSHGIALYKCKNIGFKNVTVKNISWDWNEKKVYCYGVEFVACQYILMDACTIEDVKATPKTNVAAGIAVNVSGLGETSKNITIQDCKIRRTWALNNGLGLGADCIVLSGRYREDKNINAVIKNCVFEDFTKRGVKAQAGSVTVKDCTFSFTSFMRDKEDAKYAIELFGSNSSAINNKIVLKSRKCGCGICVYGMGKTTIKRGELVFDEREITSKIIITGNVIEADTLNYAILIGEPDTKQSNLYRDILIKYNVISGALTIKNGIKCLDPIENATIEKNVFNNVLNGICLNSPAKTIREDDLTINYYPLYKAIVIRDNELTGAFSNQQYGILFERVENSRVEDNKIEGFKNGVYLGAPSTSLLYNCNIENNTFIRCGWGVETTAQCKSVKIVKNKFEGSTITDMTLTKGGEEFEIKGNITPKAVFDKTKKAGKR